jgi:manganese efflux pump family protein
LAESRLIAQLAVLGIVVAANNLAVSLALGSMGQIARRGRVVIVFGLVEFIIPFVGILLGRQTSERIESAADWVAPLLLLLMGLWAIRAAFRGEDFDRSMAERLTTWRGLILLSLGLSVDNLVVGFSLGLQRGDPLLIATVIAVSSMIFSWIGMGLGGRADHVWENRAQFVAGLLLIGMAAATWAGWL